MLEKILIVVAILVVVVAIGIMIYFYRNMNYDKNTYKKLKKIRFAEERVATIDGTIINYGEGPSNGIPLLLIHGQMVSWEDYTKVLPELSKHFHIYAVDCHGHGKTSKQKEKYSAEKMGKDFIWFIENTIRQPVVISGQSSDGLLTAWLAANAQESVLGIIIEDAPFFATEPNRREKTFAWQDGFKVIHNFHQQTEQPNYTKYYIETAICKI